MVNTGVSNAREAERALVLGYARPADRAGLRALLALDARLGDLLRQTSEPIMAQMRLFWWREALASLGQGAPPADPVLVALAREVLPRGVNGAALAEMVDGWEALLDVPLDEAALTTHGHKRGGRLFYSGAMMVGVEPAQARAAGEGWALADCARNVRDPATAAMTSSLAGARFAAAFGFWPAPARALGGLALVARMDLAGTSPASPRRVARLALFRLTGR